MRKKAVFITNIPSPYRVDFFVYLQKNFLEYEFHVIFSGAGMENRQWSVELRELENAVFLKDAGSAKAGYGICDGVQSDDSARGALVRAASRSVCELDGRDALFRAKYRARAASFQALHHKARGGVCGEQHCLKGGAGGIRRRPKEVFSFLSDSGYSKISCKKRFL